MDITLGSWVILSSFWHLTPSRQRRGAALLDPGGDLPSRGTNVNHCAWAPEVFHDGSSALGACTRSWWPSPCQQSHIIGRSYMPSTRSLLYVFFVPCRRGREEQPAASSICCASRCCLWISQQPARALAAAARADAADTLPTPPFCFIHPTLLTLLTPYLPPPPYQSYPAYPSYPRLHR